MPVVARPASRTLAEIAVENAVEGCVHETFAALLASWQATNAADAGVRAAMAVIAEDETRHAALAWAVADWSRPLLDDTARARVDAAYAEAFARLEAMAAPDAELVAAGILPSREETGRLVASLRALLTSVS